MIDQLWAPWRVQLFEQKSRLDSCIFCEFPSRPEAEDCKTLIVHRGESAFIIQNAFPYSNGHLMVIPYRHTGSLDSLTEAEAQETLRLVRLSVNLLKAVYSPEGFNIGMNLGAAAGAGIASHLHWHVVPRWTGDTNFMTALGGVRVVPESLPATHERLRAALPAVIEACKSRA
jgi:ATP adenylyltransferase